MSKTAAHFIAAIALILVLVSKTEAEPNCVQFIENKTWHDSKRNRCRIETDQYKDGLLGMKIRCDPSSFYWYIGDLKVKTSSRNSTRCDIRGGSNLIRTSDQSYSVRGFLTRKSARLNLTGRDDGRRELIRARR